MELLEQVLWKKRQPRVLCRPYVIASKASIGMFITRHISRYCMIGHNCPGSASLKALHIVEAVEDVVPPALVEKKPKLVSEP